jgi:ADP-heptose:LPS heptosyltransferase
MVTRTPTGRVDGRQAGRTLAVRLDNAGDVLVTGPAIRAIAHGSQAVDLLAGPRGRAAATLLPGVDEVLVWHCPWIDAEPAPVDAADVRSLVGRLAARRYERALVFTSFHQSALPTALLLRLAGVTWVGAISVDYPGSLLDLRHRAPEDLPEPERALSLARAAGFSAPPHDTGGLAVRRPLPDVGDLLPPGPYVVLHPGTSVPARAWPVERFAETARLLADRGVRVVVTGGPGEEPLTAAACATTPALDLGGVTSLQQLAAVLSRAVAVVVGNTGPAHLAAAVGTPVVSLFAPTVPAVRWAPYQVPRVLLGDQQAPCRDSRLTQCPYPGHPCLGGVTAEEVVAAVEQLAGDRLAASDPISQEIST